MKEKYLPHQLQHPETDTFKEVDSENKITVVQCQEILRLSRMHGLDVSETDIAEMSYSTAERTINHLSEQYKPNTH